MKIFTVFNPVSGAKKWSNVPEVVKETLKKNDHEFFWFETQKTARGEWQNFPLAKIAGADKIIVIGGDGTVSEVIDFLLRNKLKIPLIILPCGSANLLAGSLGIFPSPLGVGIGAALEKSLKNTAPQLLDAMLVNRSRYGMIAVGRGYDAFVMKETARPLKRKFGLFAYALTILKTALFYRAAPYRLTVDGTRHHVFAKTIVVINILPLPKFLINPRDGILDVFALTGRHRLLHYTGKNISIKAKKELRFEIDGEVFKGKTVTIEVIRNAVQIA
jgi:diacylglycerol kinase family enzyme